MILCQELKVKVNSGTLPVKACGHDTGYSCCPIISNFICKLFMIRGGTLLIFGHMFRSHGQLWPPVRGCHAFALSSYLLQFESFGKS